MAIITNPNDSNNSTVEYLDRSARIIVTQHVIRDSGGRQPPTDLRSSVAFRLIMAFRMLSLAAFIFALLLAPVIEASEMDSFTRRKELFSLYEPANPALDAIVNGFMADAASRVNMHLNKSGSSTIDCTNTYKKMEDTLYDLVGHWYILGVNTMISNMERQLNPGKSRYYLNATTGDNIPIPIMKNDRSQGVELAQLPHRALVSRRRIEIQNA